MKAQMNMKPWEIFKHETERSETGSSNYSKDQGARNLKNDAKLKFQDGFHESSMLPRLRG
jgi:hypothetical protein